MVGKPVIFIPSPNVSEDHQTKNALAIAKNKAALLIAEKDLESSFELEFSTVLNSKLQQELLSENIKKLALREATKTIVDEIEKLLVK